jgi:hypothetical protein
MSFVGDSDDDVGIGVSVGRVRNLSEGGGLIGGNNGLLIAMVYVRRERMEID